MNFHGFFLATPVPMSDQKDKSSRIGLSAKDFHKKLRLHSKANQKEQQLMSAFRQRVSLPSDLKDNRQRPLLPKEARFSPQVLQFVPQLENHLDAGKIDPAGRTQIVDA